MTKEIVAIVGIATVLLILIGVLSNLKATKETFLSHNQYVPKLRKRQINTIINNGLNELEDKLPNLIINGMLTRLLEANTKDLAQDLTNDIMTNLRNKDNINELVDDLKNIYNKSRKSINRSINNFGKGINIIHDGLHINSRLRTFISQIMRKQKTTSNHHKKSFSYNTSTPKSALSYMTSPSI